MTAAFLRMNAGQCLYAVLIICSAQLVPCLPTHLCTADLRVCSCNQWWLTFVPSFARHIHFEDLQRLWTNFLGCLRQFPILVGIECWLLSFFQERSLRGSLIWYFAASLFAVIVREVYLSQFVWHRGFIKGESVVLVWQGPSRFVYVCVTRLGARHYSRWQDYENAWKILV